MYFPRGVLKIATNGGKTLLAAGLYLSFKQKTIILTNSTELFRQGLVEWEELLPGKVGFIGGGKVKWNDFMICMVKTLHNRRNEYASKIGEYKVVVVDECDLADNKTYKDVLKYLFNAPVKVGLTGTIYMSKLKKDLPKNMNLKKAFGEQLDEVTNRELIDKGHSSKVTVNFIKGNTLPVPKDLEFRDIYTQFVVKNKKRNIRIVKRVANKYLEGKKPILVIAQRQAHILKLYKRLKKKLPGAKIDWVHHDRKERFTIIDEFKDGHLEILVGSMILRRGKNFPLMQYMINAAGGKNPEGPIQLLGRAMRKHFSKEVTEYEDIWDEGQYLKSHSRRRAAYYKAEQIPVTNKYS